VRASALQAKSASLRAPHEAQERYFTVFSEIDHSVMAITADKVMVGHVAPRELICTGGPRCVRPLSLPLPPPL
jgi:hypothetical protein